MPRLHKNNRLFGFCIELWRLHPMIALIDAVMVVNDTRAIQDFMAFTGRVQRARITGMSAMLGTSVHRLYRSRLRGDSL